MIVRTVLAVAIFALGVAAPVAGVQAQSGKVYRIGILSVGDPSRLRESLRELGYVEGRNVRYELRDTEGKAERHDALAADLVRTNVDVIIATYPGAVFAVKRATSTIPIVMVNTPDPVQLGLVSSLANPGGNITGTTSLSVDVSVKQLEILKEAVPGASRIAILWNPDNPWHPLVVRALGERNRLPGVKLQLLPLRRPEEFDGAFDAMARERADAVLIPADPMLHAPQNRRRLVQLAIERRLPSMGGLRPFAEAGGMMSYWAEETELYRRVASYVDRILKGAKPGTLPIEQPKEYELVVNLKTTKALGRTIPPPLMLRATTIE